MTSDKLSPTKAASALILAVSLSLVTLGPGVVFAQAQMSQSEVEERLTCQCGCGLTVASCNHLQCSFRNPLREEITERLGKGEAGETIIDDFVERYGEKILSSPTTSGFNLLAWTGPYIAIVIAGALILWRFGLLGRRKDGGGDDNDADNSDGAVISDADRDRLRKELGDI